MAEKSTSLLTRRSLASSLTVLISSLELMLLCAMVRSPYPFRPGASSSGKKASRSLSSNSISGRTTATSLRGKGRLAPLVRFQNDVSIHQARSVRPQSALCRPRPGRCSAPRARPARAQNRARSSRDGPRPGKKLPYNRSPRAPPAAVCGGGKFSSSSTETPSSVSTKKRKKRPVGSLTSSTSTNSSCNSSASFCARRAASFTGIVCLPGNQTPPNRVRHGKCPGKDIREHLQNTYTIFYYTTLWPALQPISGTQRRLNLHSRANFALLFALTAVKNARIMKI